MPRDEIADYRLHKMLTRKLATLPEDKLKLVNTFRTCSRRVMKSNGAPPAVFVLKNGEQQRYWGFQRCQNAWACPICTPRVMAKHAGDIACAIEAMKAQGKVGIMLTFTVLHSRIMSCSDTFDILLNTWSAFVTKGNKNRRGVVTSRNKITGKIKTYTAANNNDPFASFCEATGCTYRIKAAEVTYGKHGWHPHFHCLFFVDKDKAKLAKDWESTLQERWNYLMRKETRKVWLRHATPERVDRRLTMLFDNPKNRGITKGCYLSLNRDGTVRIAQSSWYIAGWGADNELSGLELKTANNGHYTPLQILEEAYRAQEVGDFDTYNHWMNKYLEFMFAVRREPSEGTKSGRAKPVVRVHYSKGLRKIIENWKLTNTYIETFKKKCTTMQAGQRWEIVIWFSARQWSQICMSDNLHDVKARILELAALDDARQRIVDFLLQYDIDCRYNTREHYLSGVVSQIFNAA